MGDLQETPRSNRSAPLSSKDEFEKLEEQVKVAEFESLASPPSEPASVNLEKKSKSFRRSSKQSIVSNRRDSEKDRVSITPPNISRKMSSTHAPLPANSDIDPRKSSITTDPPATESRPSLDMGSEGGLSKSKKRLSKSKQEEVSSILSQLKAIAAAESHASEDEGSSTPKDHLQHPQQEEARGSGASISSHHPYNVIFENSDEASINTVNSQSENNLMRGIRERLLKNELVLNGSDGIDKFATTLAALKKRTNLETHNLENILDVWCRELRQAIVAENISVQERVLHEFDNVVKDLLQSRQKDVDRLHSDIDSLHNLCRSYSKAINQRDKTIANLADALAGHKEQAILARGLTTLKTEAEESRQEKIRETLAKNYYQRTLVQRFFNAWHGVVQERWRGRIEKACQKRAEEVCHQMADQYDKRIAEMEETIRRLQEENKSYRRERDQVTVKARNALLHGVSVLKTEVSHFPGASGDSSEPGSRKTSKAEDTRKVNSHSSTNRTNASSEHSNGGARSRRINSDGSGPVPYAVEKHFESQPNSGKSASSVKTNRSSATAKS